MSTDKAMVTDAMVEAAAKAMALHDETVRGIVPDWTTCQSIARTGLSAALAQAEQPVERSEWPHLIQLCRTLGMFASAIKSGEAWSEALQREYDLANQAGKDIWADLILSHPPAKREADEQDSCCPICAEPFKLDDICASDITEGTCHAACLEGSPVVDLDTGEEIPGGRFDTYPYSEIMDPPAKREAGEAAAPVQDVMGIELAARFVEKRLNDYCAEQGWEDEFNSLSPEQQGKIRHCAERFGVPLIAADYRAKDLDVIEDTPPPQPSEATPQSDALPSPQQREDTR